MIYFPTKAVFGLILTEIFMKAELQILKQIGLDSSSAINESGMFLQKRFYLL
jgi:hypothetical protein